MRDSLPKSISPLVAININRVTKAIATSTFQNCRQRQCTFLPELRLVWFGIWREPVLVLPDYRIANLACSERKKSAKTLIQPWSEVSRRAGC